MCNDYEQQIAWEAYTKAMAALELGVAIHNSEIDLAPADDVRIGDLAPVMRAAGNAIELVPMGFGFPPAKPKGPPVFNYRSEGRKFGGSRRCVIPASAFFEFTGTKYPKAKHRFTLNDAPFMGIAGIWRECGDDRPPTFAMLTTAPGPDVEPIHDRQIVVLPPSEWGAWIYLSKPEARLLRSLPAGSLSVETVRPGSD